MNSTSNAWNITSWILGILFIVIGVLNVFLVHVVPGIIYMIISLVYLPPVNAFLKKKSGFLIPVVVKIIIAIAILWFTLAVGDLMEIFESKLLQ